jgi:peptidoglycan/LPS O-acetylase OafA/YrhL
LVTAANRLIRPVMPELDSLRGIAILSVLFLHGFYWQYSEFHFSRWASLFLRLTSPGGLGVNLFFVLSGFLITGILLDSRQSPNYYRRFYVRRALRILPAYYGLLLLLAIFREASAPYLSISLIYLSNLTDILGVSNDYGPLWSLAVEEHYYILWPFVVRRMTVRTVGLLAFAICLIVPLLRMWAFSIGTGDGLSRYTWLVADGLAMGGLIACILRTSISRQSIVRLSAALFVAVPLLVLAGKRFGILTRREMLGAALQFSLIHLFFAGVLLLLLLVGTSSRNSWANFRPLKFFGYISYGLYLIHLLIFRLYDHLCRNVFPNLQPTDGHFNLVVLRFVITASVAIGISYLSRKYFEERFLKLKDYFAAPAMVPPAPEAVTATKH